MSDEVKEVKPKAKKKKTAKKKLSGAAIHIDLEQGKYIKYELVGKEKKQLIGTAGVKLFSGRIYFISVIETKINSDDYLTLKVFSSLADKIDVRYIKDGISCIIALQHGINLRHKEHICSVF